DRPINQVEIAQQEDWQTQHLNAIKAAYAKARFFKIYIGFFEWIYRSRRWENLFELNWTLLAQLLAEFRIRTTTVVASDYGMAGSKSELVLNYCLNFGARLYVFGQSGRLYARRERFLEHGVHLVFQEYAHPVYDQGPDPFLAKLSAIDLLFHHGPDAGS